MAKNLRVGAASGQGEFACGQGESKGAQGESAGAQDEFDGGAASKYQSLYFYGDTPQFLPLEATAPLSARLVMDFPDYL